MLRLDENLWVDAQITAPRHAECELDVPTHGHGVQHYTIEGFCMNGSSPDTDYEQLGHSKAQENSI